MQLHTQLPQRGGGLLRQRGAEGGERGVAAVEQEDPGVLGVDVPELRAQGTGGELADLSGELDPGGTGADHGEGEPPAELAGVGRALGELERPEHPATDRQRVVDGLHPGGPLRELVVPEVGLAHACGDDQVVVGQRDALAVGASGHDQVGVDVDVDHLGQHAFDVAVPLEHDPQGRGDLALGQDPGRDLVQQRLEQVVLRAVDEGDRDVAAAQRPGGEEPAEAAADDDDPVSCGAVHVPSSSGRLSRRDRASRRRRGAGRRPPWAPRCHAGSGARAPRRPARGRRRARRPPPCPGGRTAPGARRARRR